MDMLFKKLIYEHIPTNSRCFGEPNTGFIRNNTNMSSDLFNIDNSLNRNSNLNSDYSQCLSCLDNKSSLKLNIAVVCVCTDTLAAFGIFNLLACAGFSLFSFLRSEDCRLVFDGNCFVPDMELRDPLVLSAIWPLIANRISANCLNLSDNRNDKFLNLCEGQVHVHLMSDHLVSYIARLDSIPYL